MRPIEETNQSMENIVFLLKSIDFQLTKLLKILTEQQENAEKRNGRELPEKKEIPRLLTTREASEMFGLSQCELRRGYKEGIYPAIEIGSGERMRQLRWRSDLLEELFVKETK